jgi:hypothetical protein
MQHREEAVELRLNTGPVAAEKPADQYGEVQLAAPAEMPRIGNMTRTQFRRMKVADEPAQYRDNPSSYREILRITTFRVLPAQPRVYKPLRLKLIGLVPALEARPRVPYMSIIANAEGSLHRKPSISVIFQWIGKIARAARPQHSVDFQE